MSELSPALPNEATPEAQKPVVELVPETAALLEKLATEDGESTTTLLTKLIAAEDEKRHVNWSRSQTKFIRHSCNRQGCPEPKYEGNDLAD